VRRQIVQVGSAFWLVLDHVADNAARKSTTTWTVDPSLSVTRGPFANAYRLEAPAGGAVMTAAFLGSPGTGFTTLKGSRNPFAGWVALESGPVAAPAFMVEQASTNSWALALWVPQDGSAGLPAAPEMVEWKDAENWSIKVPLPGGVTTVERAGNEYVARLGSDGGKTTRVALAAAPDISAERAAIHASFDALRASSRKRPDLLGYRIKISCALAVLLVVQEGLYFLLRTRLRGYRVLVRGVLGAAWIAGGVWLAAVYLT
jgi:hypothetical protein